jgi:hypothetical protein
MELLNICARWVAFLPVAFVAAWLAWILSKFFNGWYTGGMWLLPAFVERGAVDALASASMGAAFAVSVSDYWAIWSCAWAMLGLVAITVAAATGELQLANAALWER